jgi:hypothetical protein
MRFFLTASMNPKYCECAGLKGLSHENLIYFYGIIWKLGRIRRGAVVETSKLSNYTRIKSTVQYVYITKRIHIQ